MKSCRKGHLMTEANTYQRPDGSKACCACTRENAARFRQRHFRADGPGPADPKSYGDLHLTSFVAANADMVRALRRYALRHDDGSARVIRAAMSLTMEGKPDAPLQGN